MPEKLLADDRMRTHLCFRRLGDFPGHFRRVLRNAAQHFAVEVFDDLRPALIPPHGRRRDLLAVLQRKNVGQIRVRIRRGLIVVGMIRRVFVAAGAGAQGLDAELVHHVLMVLRRGPVLGIDGALRG